MDGATARELLEIKNRLTRIEQALSKYATDINECTQGDVDYLAMELDVDLDQDSGKDPLSMVVDDGA